MSRPRTLGNSYVHVMISTIPYSSFNLARAFEALRWTNDVSMSCDMIDRPEYHTIWNAAPVFIHQMLNKQWRTRDNICSKYNRILSFVLLHQENFINHIVVRNTSIKRKCFKSKLKTTQQKILAMRLFYIGNLNKYPRYIIESKKI